MISLRSLEAESNGMNQQGPPIGLALAPRGDQWPSVNQRKHSASPTAGSSITAALHAAEAARAVTVKQLSHSVEAEASMKILSGLTSHGGTKRSISGCSSFNASAPVFVPSRISRRNSPTILAAAEAGAAAAAAEHCPLTNKITEEFYADEGRPGKSRPADTRPTADSVHVWQQRQQHLHKQQQRQTPQPQPSQLPMQQSQQYQQRQQQLYQPLKYQQDRQNPLQEFLEFQQKTQPWQLPHQQSFQERSNYQLPHRQQTPYGMFGFPSLPCYASPIDPFWLDPTSHIVLTGVCLACWQITVKPPALLMM